MIYKLSRRNFTKLGIGTGIALVIGISYRSSGNDNSMEKNDTFKPDIWISVEPDNSITITITESEMGQGVFTTLPMLVAEEMNADWKQMKAIPALADNKYGKQQTGGSSSIRKNWEKLRLAGAAAREVLLLAAAKTWNTKITHCIAESGYITNTKNDARLSFGELVEVARTLPLPEKVSLKSPDKFKIIGTSVPRLDSTNKITGKAIYGSDTIIKGMLTATVIHPPTFGGKVKSIDSRAAKKLPGVHDVLKIKEGIAIVADDYWSASQGAKALKIKWTNGSNINLNDETINKKLKSTLSQKCENIVRNQGDAKQAISSTSQRVEAEYSLPYQAHATLEPMTCTANVSNGICEVWAPTQSPTKAKNIAAILTQSKLDHLFTRFKRRIFNQSDSKTIINTTLLGGGFGRRLQTDFISEAVQISKAVKAPIRLIWSREEDIQHDFYRPISSHKIVASIDDKGWPIVWWHRAAGPSLNLSGAQNIPYDIPNIRVEGTEVDIPIPTGPWRSVNHSYNAFVIETFIDELAAIYNHDPLEYRLRLLSNEPQYRHVLQQAADKAQWGKPLTEGHYQGIATYKCFGTYVAQVAEISLNKDKGIKVHKVTAAIDCGLVINPDIVAAQMEGAITFGLTAALKSKISIKNGHVEQSNFHDFPLLRFDEMPEIETIIIKSNKSPEGIGEPGVPSIAPAVANAVFAATGSRQRKLPLKFIKI